MYDLFAHNIKRSYICVYKNAKIIIMYLSKNVKYNNNLDGHDLTTVKKEKTGDFIIDHKDTIIDSFENFVMRKGGDREDVNRMYDNLRDFQEMYNVDLEEMFFESLRVDEHEMLFEMK